MKRAISMLMCIIIALTTFSSIVSASDVMPCYNNAADFTSVFSINSSGKATVTVSYTGRDNVADEATITVKLQKKFLVFFWRDVEIGQPDNTWTSHVYTTEYSNVYTHYLSDTGTYRAIVTCTASGSGGADDVIEHEHEYSY